MSLRLCHYSDFENAVDDPDRVGRVAALLSALRSGEDEGGGEDTGAPGEGSGDDRSERPERPGRSDEVVVLDGGDAMGPSLLGRETDGGHVPRVHRALGTDLATVGNHDLDYGRDSLLSVVAESPATYLSANLRVDGDLLADREGAERWTVLNGRDGPSVAVTGVTGREAVRSHAVAAEEGVTADPSVPAVESALSAARREQSVDAAVVLSHAGQADDRIARNCEVAAVLGGHVHEPRLDRVDGTPVAWPGPRGNRIHELRPDGVAAGSDGSPGVDAPDDDGTRRPGIVVHPVGAVDDRPRYARNGATDRVTDRRWVAYSDAVDRVDVDETAADVVQSARVDLGLDDPVTELDRPLTRARADLFPESRVGNVVADAYRRAADADVALFNVGMLRVGPPLSGTVTVGDCRSLTPFDNDVHATTLSGAELRRLFESLTRLSSGLARGQVHAHVSGADLRYRYRPDGAGEDADRPSNAGTATDPDADRGEATARTPDPGETGPWTLVSAAVGGDPVDPDRGYAVAAPSFAFHVDGFAPLAPDRIETDHGDQHEALTAHLRTVDQLPGLEGRVTIDRAGES